MQKSRSRDFCRRMGRSDVVIAKDNERTNTIEDDERTRARIRLQIHLEQRRELLKKLRIPLIRGGLALVLWLLSVLPTAFGKEQAAKAHLDNFVGRSVGGGN